MIVFFDSSDRESRELLETCGLDPDALLLPSGRQGAVRDRDAEPALFEFLRHCAAVEPHGKDSPRFALSSFEALYGLVRVKPLASSVLRGLFSPGYGPDGATAQVILRNKILERPYYEDFTEPVAIEESLSCRALEETGFSVADQEGIFYAESAVPERWREAGEAVVEILDDSSTASGAIVKRNGRIEIWTARHAAFDATTGALSSGLRVRFRGRDYLVCPEHLIASDADLDVARFSIPELEAVPGLPALRLSRRHAARGETVFAAGFPGLDGRADGLLYSVGRYDAEESKTSSAASRYVKISAQTFPGNSGGPVCNERGELVGIVVAREIQRREAPDGTVKAYYFPHLSYAVPAGEILSLATFS